MEAPETRGAARLIETWKPDLFIDLHTTNGSYHGYALTFAAGLNPNATPANDYARYRLLPLVRQRMRERHGRGTFWYGNFRNQEPDSLAQGWETYDARPRFGTNWAGMRGHVAILSEAYSNDDFRTRVAVTHEFVREILSLAAQERAAIRSAVAASRSSAGDSIAVRSQLAAPVVQEVVAEITESAGEGAGGYARRRRTGVFRPIRMPVYDRFAGSGGGPSGGLSVPPSYGVAELLRRQGIVV
jgi:hypothetical protein